MAKEVIRSLGKVNQPVGALAPDLTTLLNLLETLLANSPAGFCFLDEYLRYVCVNQPLAALRGYAPEQHLGRTVRELTPHLALMIEPALQRVLKTSKPEFNLEVKLPQSGSNAEIQSTLVSFYPILGKSGALIGIGGMFIDITEQKRVEEENHRLQLELERSNKDLERYAAVASHDLSEPLRTITSFLNLLGLRNKGMLDEKSLEYISFIKGGAAQMRGLIDDLLRYSKASARRQVTPNLDLTLVMKQTLSNLSVAIEESGASITYDALPRINGDCTQLNQLFQNLIANAIKFRRKDTNPAIHVSVEKKSKEWLFIVKDDGIGF